MELKQLATGRMTRKGYVLFGRIRLCLNKRGQQGSNAMFSLVNTPMFEQEAPTCFVIMAYEPDQEGYFTAMLNE